jgi:hypothetical protein
VKIANPICVYELLHILFVLIFFLNILSFLSSFFCKADALWLEPHLQSIFLWLFWRQGLANYLPGLALNVILLISASQVMRITGMSHQHLASSHLFSLLFFTVFHGRHNHDAFSDLTAVYSEEDKHTGF